MENNCWLPKRVTQLAREKGLLKPGEGLICPFAQGCLGIDAIGEESCNWLNQLEENPPYRTIFLQQGHHPPPPTPMKRFYNRLKKTAEIRV